MIDVERPVLALVVIVAAVAGVAYLEFTSTDAGDTSGPDRIEFEGNDTDRIAEKRGEYRRARPIEDPAGFINTDEVSIERELDSDRVVLVDFWTYSCINCQRTLPYLNAWHAKYADDGLTIVGVHSPEFEFEENPENVADAVDRYGIAYPVVLDNSRGTWNNYDNRFWPQKYLIDHDGFIRYEHIGEGSYAETERKIQQLLRERARATGIEPSADLSSDPVDPDAEAADFSAITTPEIYFGAGRNAKFLGNADTGTTGTQELTLPPAEDRQSDLAYLGGTWDFEKESATARSAGSTIALEYGAKDVNVVAEGDGPIEATVRIDGEAPGEAAGADVAPDGSVTIEEERLYDLVKHEGYGRHRITITAEESGLSAYTFTFG
jgi:thiol-disulfide isomerase/thioredoxin